jgi:hypothetical protein
MADDKNTAEREAFYAWLRTYEDEIGALDDASAWVGFIAGRASLAASAGSTEINGHLYTALNNLFTHLGMEGCITADHAFVWDAMAALKRIDGGVHLDNLAVPVDPDAHRDDMLAAVRLLEDGEWAEHFAKTPIGMRLEDQITKLHNEVAASAGSEPVAAAAQSALETLERTHQSLARQIDLIAERAPGNFLDKRPVVSTLTMHQRRTEAAAIALRTALVTHPSPPEGMAGWRQGVEEVAAMLTKKADDFAKEHGHDDMGGLSFGRGAHADAKLDYHSGLLEIADEVREMRSEATPELSSDNRVLMEHSGCGRGTQIDTLTVRLNPGDKVILCPGPVTRASIAAPPLPASEAKEL